MKDPGIDIKPLRRDSVLYPEINSARVSRDHKAAEPRIMHDIADFRESLRYIARIMIKINPVLPEKIEAGVFKGK
jgi:hypothetical protein